MKKTTATLLANYQVAETLFQMDFLFDTSVSPLPGQFLTVRITDTCTPLLRRPFAFSAFQKSANTASVIYQVRGKGTKLLSSFNAGTTLDIIAPLGKPFPEPPSGGKTILTAGGIGLGPILFLASYLKKQQRDFTLVFGCKSAAYLPSAILSSFAPAICTDDGSTGFHGTVTDYIESEVIPADTVIYSCGPQPMLHACHLLADKYAIPCFISVEQTMACGVGACMGCVVKVNGPEKFVRACKEGPVFNSKDIAWD